MINNLRNPNTVYFFVFSAVMMALLEASLYYKIGHGKLNIWVSLIPDLVNVKGCAKGLEESLRPVIQNLATSATMGRETLI